MTLKRRSTARQRLTLPIYEMRDLTTSRYVQEWPPLTRNALQSLSLSTLSTTRLCHDLTGAIYSLRKIQVVF